MRESRESAGRRGRRLVLGFDGGCMACSDLARRIEEHAGHELEMRPLGEPQVERWRRASLGEDPPWVPTLLEATEGRVRAWTGWRLGLKLLRTLGPAATWKVLQVLGETGVPGASHPPRAGGGAPGLTRGQFLRGVSGGVVAASVLAGLGPVAGRARAKGWTHPFERVRFVDKRSLEGREKRGVVEEALASPDLRNVWDGRVPDLSRASAVRHTLEGGNTLTAVSWVLSGSRVVVHYAVARPIGNYRTQAILLEVDPSRDVTNAGESINGTRRSTGTASTAPRGASGRPTALSCGCKRWRWGCIAHVASTVCLTCGGTCAGCVATPAKWTCITCLSCLLVGCPVAARSCCRRW